MYDWDYQKTFSRRLYGDDGSFTLAREWVRRARYFFGLWGASHFSEDFVYTDADVEDYDEDLVFVEWMCELDIDSVSFARASEMRRLTPFNQADIDLEEG